MYAAVKQHESPLVNAEWVKDAQQKLPNLVILDVSIPMPGEKRDCLQEFRDCHIPGARFLSLLECREKESDNAYMLPKPEVFAEHVAKLGITNSTKVVLYDANEKKGMFSSPRAWYMFRVFGHTDLHILDGGLLQWKAAGFDTEKGYFKELKAVKYTPTFNANLVISLEQIKTNLDKKEWKLIDARSPGRLAGTAPEPRPDIKPGRIPNSQGCFWINLLDSDKKVFKSPEELRKCYEEISLNPNEQHVASCGSGVTACFLALTSYILGNLTVPIYDGAWFDWFLHAPDELKENVPSS